ncbi:MAG: thiol reductase thioredoxin [Oscillospiraceae bacterium]|nr:thiol reductase thioredoxin [Oscillospiraceae bacterium]MBQ4545591.1 thiol reductase thioredoxin [Oscillospiraceae bacterium]MBQ4642853.1 thiol reductase thioredoxin [Oscillospiraceae bacterium]
MSVININKHSFRKEVLESEKPVLLDIWVPWSGRNSASVAEEIAAERDDIKVVRMNAHDSPELSAELNIKHVPSMALFKNGKMISKTIETAIKSSVLAII